MSNLIHVGLYGDGSRKCRLRAEYIYCDHADECSAHKKGLCFCVTSLFSTPCKLGHVSCVDGGTKQSKKYYKVHDEAQKNPMRSKLKYPSNDYVTRIGDKCLLTVPNISAKKDETGKLVLSDPGFRGCNLILDLEELTPETLKRICSFRPRAIMGGVIESYQTKTIPMFLFQFSKLFPDEYQAFTSAYPEYADLKLDFRGKWAKLSTCNRDVEYRNGKNGEVFRFDGDYLVSDEFSPRIIFQDTRVKGVLRVPLTEKMEVEITDNEQVTPETVFI